MKPVKGKKLPQTERLVAIVGELRRKCPWDKKQTHRTLIQYLIEEAYETVDAIESGRVDPLREELGDLLLQVVLHAEIEAQKKRFTFEDVARGIADKMVRRHPHVFGKGAKHSDPKKHSKTWTELKAKEKPDRGLLDGTPRALPGLQLAQRYGEIASSVGFDWKEAKDVVTKVHEEMGELETEIAKGDRGAMEMELGDLFFTLANLARHLGLDADAAARKAAAKFGDRFSRLEKEKKTEGKRLADCAPEELEAGWAAIKRVTTAASRTGTPARESTTPRSSGSRARS